MEPARRVLGRIDLDPASCALANGVVQAERTFAIEDDGLSVPWTGRAFLNPPGGKDGNESLQKRWWYYLAAEWASGRVFSAIYVAFSVEFLQVAQVAAPPGLPSPP